MVIVTKITTADCRKFLVSQVPSVIYPATSWAYDADSGWDELANELYPTNADPDENDPVHVAKAKAYAAQNAREVYDILSKESNWKRYLKEKGSGHIAIVRRFNCDTKEGRFDGQVAYEVLEDVNGTLSLGQYVGD